MASDMQRKFVAIFSFGGPGPINGHLIGCALAPEGVDPNGVLESLWNEWAATVFLPETQNNKFLNVFLVQRGWQVVEGTYVMVNQPVEEDEED